MTDSRPALHRCTSNVLTQCLEKENEKEQKRWSKCLSWTNYKAQTKHFSDGYQRCFYFDCRWKLVWAEKQNLSLFGISSQTYFIGHPIQPRPLQSHRSSLASYRFFRAPLVFLWILQIPSDTSLWRCLHAASYPTGAFQTRTVVINQPVCFCWLAQIVYFLVFPWFLCFYRDEFNDFFCFCVEKWNMIQSLHSEFYFENWPDSLRCSCVWLPAWCLMQLPSKIEYYFWDASETRGGAPGRILSIV